MEKWGTNIEILVIDASAVIDLLLRNDSGSMVIERVRGHRLVAPAHLDAEVLSAFARIARAGGVDLSALDLCLEMFGSMPLRRYPTQDLVMDAWNLRHNLRVLDALYIALARRLDTVVVTTDRGMSVAHPLADHIGADRVV